MYITILNSDTLLYALKVVIVEVLCKNNKGDLFSCLSKIIYYFGFHNLNTLNFKGHLDSPCLPNSDHRKRIKTWFSKTIHVAIADNNK